MPECARAGPWKSAPTIAEPWCRDKIEQPPTWLASVNAAYLGEYLDRDSAMARVEANIESNMQTVLNDWGCIRRKEKRPVERREPTGGN
jgi:hypothetical protein